MAEGPRGREAEAEAGEVLRGWGGVREIAGRLRGRCHRLPPRRRRSRASGSRAGSAGEERGARRGADRGERGDLIGRGIKCARLSRGIPPFEIGRASCRERVFLVV